METFDMKIVYIVDIIIFLILFGKTIYHQVKKQHYKVELSFFIMLLWVVVVTITFFGHFLYMLHEGKDF